MCDRHAHGRRQVNSAHCEVCAAIVVCRVHSRPALTLWDLRSTLDLRITFSLPLSSEHFYWHAAPHRPERDAAGARAASEY